MISVYAAALAAGIVFWLGRAWIEKRDGGGSAEASPKGDVSLPGARGERSDEYAVAGGVGGAEGEGGAPGSHDAEDGGIGGAEGESESSDSDARRPSGLALAALTLAAFGATGIVLNLVVPGMSEVAAAGIAALGAVGLSGIAGSRESRERAE